MNLLSKKELQVYKLIHLNTRQIAFELDMMDKTVKFHKTNIYKKLGVKGAWEIICGKNLQSISTAQKRPIQRRNSQEEKDLTSKQEQNQNLQNRS
jgi:DNA-binding CsgD family transcriptional regulator